MLGRLGLGRFNPHSPLLANEFCTSQENSADERVSIHIRHCWRMNCRLTRDECGRLMVSIHIRHCWRMNSGWWLKHSARWWVSIHIRHCWRMNSGNVSEALDLELVSIHIRHCWRMKCLDQWQACRYNSSFNPHSPLLANEFVG